MKTEATKRNVATNAGETRQFSIAANGKAFKILIDGLYSDKIKSITREIWANALDGHQAAGCADRPFEVTFPSVFDSVFRVRDFGASLTHNDVMELYTTIFASTKEDTNDATGKFGLGSKAPFAYTDTFSVTTVLDGVQRHYATMIGEDDIPTINFMGENPTDEENGVQVSFPVASDDIDAFRTAAKNVAYGFDVRPLIGNNDESDYTWPEFNKSVSGEDWFFFDERPFGYTNRAYAKMGCVLYPIDASAMKSLTSVEEEFLGNDMVIEFPMGSLEINASRESLSYGRNDPTEVTIKKRIAEIIDEWAAKSLDEISSAPSFFEASMMLGNLFTYSTPAVLRNHVKDKAAWNGMPVTENIVWSPSGKERFARGISINVLTYGKLSRKTYPFSGTKELYVTPNADTHVVIEDVTPDKGVKRGPARIRKFYEDSRMTGSGFKTLVWIRFTECKRGSEELLAVLDLLDGVSSITMASDLDVPAVVRRDQTARKPVPLRMAYSYSNFNRPAELIHDDFVKGGFYVPLLRGEVQRTPHTQVGDNNATGLFSALQRIGAIDATAKLYGVPGTYHTKFAREDNWVNLFDFANDYLENTFDTDGYNKYLTAKYACNAMGTMPMLRAIEESDHTVGGALKDAIDYALDASTIFGAETGEHLAALKRVTCINSEEHEKDNELRAQANIDAAIFTDAIRESYPMVAVLLDFGINRSEISDETLDKLVSYVHMCDTEDDVIESLAA